MPRQAARLVLGRSAKAKPFSEASRLRTFSTTPRRWDDDANDDNNSHRDRDPLPNTRRERSVAAASALGAMSTPGAGESSSSSSSSLGGGRRLAATTLTRPPGLGARPGGIISLKSLPRRADGAPRPLLRRQGQLGGDGDRPPPGSPGFVPRFAGRPGLDGGLSRPSRDGGLGSREGGYVARGGGFRGGRSGDRLGGGRFGGNRFGGASDRFNTPGGFGQQGGVRRGRGGGRGGGRFGGRGGRGGRGRGGRKPMNKGKKDEEHEADDASAEEMLSQEVLDYVEEQEQAGPERPYIPSTTLESLIGWGPAVATNTALGQAEIAMRNMRIMGGGRAYSELEQSFRIADVQRWSSAGKPIMYSRIEQKKASLMMLDPARTERKVDKNIDGVIERLKTEHGSNYSAFVEAYKRLGSEKEQRANAKKLAEENFDLLVNDWDLTKTKNKTTREAIIKYAIKGHHPEVKDADDTWGKLARYHAHSPTYRPADGAKFDEKMRSLVRT